MYPMNKQNLHPKAWVQCLLSADLQAWIYCRWLGPSSLTSSMISVNSLLTATDCLLSLPSQSNVLELSLIYDLSLVDKWVSIRECAPEVLHFHSKRLFSALLYCILWQRMGAKFRWDWKRLWGLSELQPDKPVYVLRHTPATCCICAYRFRRTAKQSLSSPPKSSALMSKPYVPRRAAAIEPYFLRAAWRAIRVSTME